MTVEDNCNPMYFEALEAWMDFDTPETAPPIVLNVWDKDDGILDSTDDFMGRAVIFLNSGVGNEASNAVISQDDSIPAVPRWHPIRMGF